MANSRAGKVIGKAIVLILKAIFYIHLVYIVFTSTLIFTYKFINPPYTVLMTYRALGYGWKLEKPILISIKKVPPYVKTMLVSVEDGKFYEHHGIDMDAFKRAREINERVGKPLYGGSTLTMQVARTLFLVPEKSYIRKYFEVITALELELFLPKDRILELYFNYAEWGKGIFGIEAAARHYYKTSVTNLTRDQAARLIALLSSPIKYTPSTLNKSGILRERYAYLNRRFVTGGQVAIDETRELPLPPVPPPGSIEPGVDVDDEAQGEESTQPVAVESPEVPGSEDSTPSQAVTPALDDDGSPMESPQTPAEDTQGAQPQGAQPVENGESIF
ncbi:MAG TPA: monofunctional biosynthetic peptidoglycan transglycosylase [Spirochaetales bacterium]|nr:monofunctional biosynthetic peptidoglycan transglycosylase [Spirochaetales bacterium]